MKRIVYALLVSFSTWSVAAAQESRSEEAIAAADDAFDAGDVDRSLELYLGALRAGGAEPQRLAHIYRRLGILHSALDHGQEGLEAFERSLAIDPAQPEPTELGPSQRTLFRAVRQGRAGVRLALDIEHSWRADRLVLELRTSNEPETWVASFRVVAGDDEEVGTVSEFSFERRERTEIPVRVEARDVYENVIAVATANLAYTPEAIPSEDDGSVRRRRWIIALSVVAVVAIGATVGVVVATQKPSQYAPPVIVW